jgi:hypothetical protein
VLFELRNALKAGDVWLADSQRYAEVETALVPTCGGFLGEIGLPLDGRLWLAARAEAVSRAKFRKRPAPISPGRRESRGARHHAYRTRALSGGS